MVPASNGAKEESSSQFIITHTYTHARARATRVVLVTQRAPRRSLRKTEVPETCHFSRLILKGAICVDENECVRALIYFYRLPLKQKLERSVTVMTDESRKQHNDVMAALRDVRVYRKTLDHNQLGL